MESPQTTQTNVVMVLSDIISRSRACDNLESWLAVKRVAIALTNMLASAAKPK